jgi:uncharacterized protein
MTIAPAALTDEELDALEAFLTSDVTPETAMPLSTLDGYFTAIALNPDLILPSRWIPWVWDMESAREVPEFESHEEAERVLGLIMRHYNEVMAAVSAGEPEPMFVGDKDGDVILANLWAGGFLVGVSKFAEPWWVALMEQDPAKVAPILLLGSASGPDSLEDRSGDLRQMIERAPEVITLALDGLCEYFAPLRARAADDRVRTHRRAEPKVGRNDPCPCGSGKKFKKCCGLKLH